MSRRAARHAPLLNFSRAATPVSLHIDGTAVLRCGDITSRLQSLHAHIVRRSSGWVAMRRHLFAALAVVLVLPPAMATGSGPISPGLKRQMAKVVYDRGVDNDSLQLFKLGELHE